MNEQWLLSVIDVAEALRCSSDDVVGFIESGELAPQSTDPLLISHDSVRSFVRERQRAALELGANSRIAPDVLALRPGIARHDDEL